MPANLEFIHKIGDLPDRVTTANDKPVLVGGAYVLAILNRALRGDDNPVIEAALCHAKALGIGVVAYSELDEQVAWASDRLFYFALGAFRECAIALNQKNISCVQTIKKTDTHLLRSLVSKAAVVYTEEDYTHWDRARLNKLLAIASQAVLFVDASRLVPVKQLPPGLKTTPAFRKAHRELRDRYADWRKAMPVGEAEKTEIALLTNHNFAHYSDRELRELISECKINHDIKISKEHPPIQAEIDRRLTTLKANGVTQRLKAS